ncbi:DUF6443 domain-containing protein, partial [Shiella aurantiaca]|uniref:DUF6443 domain-containing protein n=1 Tax=Shiella aurantiaca TaxID=3058365 RepID=UPI0029F512EA
MASYGQVSVITGPDVASSAPAGQVYVAEGGSYTLRPVPGGSILLSTGTLITTDGSMLTLPTTSTADMNYVKTVTPRVASTSTTSLKLSQKNVSYQYYDGLGRPVQQVAQAASPQFKDIVSNVAYDAVGRQYREYLPYSPTTNDGGYKNDWESAQSAFYGSGTTTDRIAND